MSHEWDSGFMVHTPSWHRLESAVLKSSPDNWEDARKEAGLMWEIETSPVYELKPSTIGPSWAPTPVEIPDWQRISRNDTKATLAIQKDTYKVIYNKVFGSVIDTVLGLDEDEKPVLEALMSLYGGRMIVALCYFEEPLKMSWDPSATYRYLAFCSRHDGEGGLRGIPTNVRVQCANTLNAAEMTDGRKVGFTIKHTASWESRVAEVGREMVAARGDSAKWLKFAEELAMWKVTPRSRDTYLKRYLPVSDDMGHTKSTNTMMSRAKIREILESPTCEGISKNGYGLLMASTEFSDHYRGHNSTDSFVSRQLLRKEEPKARSSRILRNMAGIKG